MFLQSANAQLFAATVTRNCLISVIPVTVIELLLYIQKGGDKQTCMTTSRGVLNKIQVDET
jgi:hypothetical protein